MLGITHKSSPDNFGHSTKESQTKTLIYETVYLRQKGSLEV